MPDSNLSRTFFYRWLLIALAASAAVYAWYVIAQYSRLNDLHQREVTDAAEELSRSFENAVATVKNLGPGADICDFGRHQHYLEPIGKCENIQIIQSDETKTDGLKISRGAVRLRFRPDSVLQELSFPESFQLVILAESGGQVLFEDEPARRRWLRQLRWGEQGFRDSAADQSGGLQVRSLVDLLGAKADPAWKQLSSASARTRLTLGGEWVQLYLQPVRFEEASLVMGGVVPLQDILRQALAVDTYFVASLVFVFLLGVLGFPFVKLIALDRCERFRLRDVYLLYWSTGALLALLTFPVVGWDAYERWHGVADKGLESFANDLEAKFLFEVAAARDQLRSYDRMLVGGHVKPPSKCEAWPVVTGWFNNPKGIPFAPLENQIDIETVSWMRPDGMQIWKITSNKANTKKISVGDRPYFRAARDLNLYRFRDDSPYKKFPSFFIAPDRSIIDSKFYTFVSIRSKLPIGFCGEKTEGGQDAQDKTDDDASKDSGYIAVATVNLLSIDKTPLPAGYGFAIVNREGRVLYHSDARLSLREDFFAELSKGPRVKATIYAGRSEAFSSRYRERPHEIFLKPLGLVLDRPQGPGEVLRISIAEQKENQNEKDKDKEWEKEGESAGLYLAVFRDVSMEQAVAARVFTTSLLGPMMLMSALSGVGLAMMARGARRRDGRPGVWLWPHGGPDDLHKRLAAGFLLLLLLGIVISLLGAGDIAFLAMPVVAAVGGLTVFYRARKQPADTRRKLGAPGWRTAMLALLLACGVIAPSAMLFHLAIGHEFGKLIRTEQESMIAQFQDVPLAAEANARADQYSPGIGRQIAKARVAHYGRWPAPYDTALEPMKKRVHGILAPQDWLDKEVLPVDDNITVREREQDFDVAYFPAGLFRVLPFSWVALAGLAVVIGLMVWWIHWNTSRLFYADLDFPAPPMIPPDLFEPSWSGCTVDERNVLLQVAREKIANPYQRSLVESLLNRGLLRLDPDLQPNSTDFAQFLLGKEREIQAELQNWEEAQGPHSWRHVRTLLFASLGVLALFLVATQPGLQSNLLGMATGITGGLTTLVKLRDAVVSWMGKGKVPG